MSRSKTVDTYQMTEKNIEYKIHDNGWTVFVNEDIRLLSDEQAKEVTRLASTNLVVIFRNQELTLNEQVEFCSKLGKCQYTYNPNKPREDQRFHNVAVHENIYRVTGEKNHNGVQGLAGHQSSLDWHVDQPSTDNRPDLAWLYGVKGTQGSCTSWLNTAMAYNDAPESLLTQIKDKKIFCGFKNNTYTENDFFTEYVNRNTAFNIVCTNKAGTTGIYYPFFQAFEISGVKQTEQQVLHTQLVSHLLQEKFMYHHNWQDGDVIIGEQWLTLHKRWAFEDMEDRLVHRIAISLES